MVTAKELRESFISYFKKQNHEVVESSSVVPLNDETLLFTNSGMVQFKHNLLGIENKFSAMKRACSVQRCIRAGGKHNDLDDVGKDTYHHTFFEMLGNWSFGDYFKKDAISFAWDLLVNGLGMPSDRLYVTYFCDEESGIDADIEAKMSWARHLPADHIVKGNFKDNFWEMGETGPCGPCSEIHYDRIGGRNAASLVNTDDPNVIEIWNLVFMQYNRSERGLEKLPVQCIDTGAGFERVLSILNDVKSNYLTDLFLPLFEYIREVGGVEEEYKDTIEGEFAKSDTSYRVLADHSRTMAVCLHDGVRPANEGRGYVLRRICRRALRYAHEVFKLKNGFLEKLVAKAGETLEIALPADKLKIVSDEETLFSRTLSKGIVMFKKLVAKSGAISARDAFMLYDTYGFPVDLTKILADENNVTVDIKGFYKEQLRFKELSRGVKKSQFRFPETRTVTEDKYKYTDNGICAELLFQSERDGQLGCVFDKTCFYYECGGQVGDTGTITFYDSNDLQTGVLTVLDTQLINATIFHIGTLEGETAKKVKLVFDHEKREKTKKNHTGTHILFYFLRKILKGERVEQEGSLVDPEKLRFDFSCTRALTLDEVKNLEMLMNCFVAENNSVVTEIIRFEDTGAEVVKVRGEEYPEDVRKISIVGKSDTLHDLCGGTHVKSTSEIAKIRIITESGIALNIRRIVAFTGDAATKAEESAREVLKAPADTNACVIPLIEKRDLEKIMESRSKEIEKKREGAICNQLFNAKEALVRCKTGLMLADDGTRPLLKFNCTCDFFSAKDVKKQIRKVAEIFEKGNVDSIVYCPISFDVHFALSAGREDLLEALKACVEIVSVKKVDVFLICVGRFQSADSLLKTIDGMK